MIKDFEKDRVVNRIECKRGYACIRVGFKEGRKEVGEILRALAEADVHFTIPKIHQDVLNFALPEEEAGKAMEKLREISYDPQLLAHCSLITVYAPDMRNLFGIMVQILEAILAKGAQVIQVGDAYDSVSCLVREEKIEEIMSALSEVFPNTAINRDER